MRARGQAIGEEFRGKGIKWVQISLWIYCIEKFAEFLSVMLGPDMDIMRSPKQGRAWEGFGPEPWLSGEVAFETVQGVQSAGVVKSTFHKLYIIITPNLASMCQTLYFIYTRTPANVLFCRSGRPYCPWNLLLSISSCHRGTQMNNYSFCVMVTLLWSQAGVVSIMCAYNRFNGTYACGNDGLLGPNGLLGQAGYQGK